MFRPWQITTRERLFKSTVVVRLDTVIQPPRKWGETNGKRLILDKQAAPLAAQWRVCKRQILREREREIVQMKDKYKLAKSTEIEIGITSENGFLLLLLCIVHTVQEKERENGTGAPPRLECVTDNFGCRDALVSRERGYEE
jgi:hypothetical protein